MYLLDTNICIYAIKGKYPSISKKLLSIPPDEIAVSVITLGELEYGAEKSKWSQQTRQQIQAFLANFKIIPFTDEDALVFGKIRAELESVGQPIGAYDMMIAAQGVHRNITVVTHNTGEFERVPGISLEDWVD